MTDKKQASNAYRATLVTRTRRSFLWTSVSSMTIWRCRVAGLFFPARVNPTVPFLQLIPKQACRSVRHAINRLIALDMEPVVIMDELVGPFRPKSNPLSTMQTASVGGAGDKP